MIARPFSIRQNQLLHGTEKTLGFDELLLLHTAIKADPSGTGRNLNLSKVSQAQIRTVHDAYGPEGLFQLMALAMAHEFGEFWRFLETVLGILALDSAMGEGSHPVLECDNARLCKSSALDRFGVNVVQPSLARKIYRAGRHHGSLVYGLGGPRILVSHPFQGRAGDTYDIYANSVDVVTSLMMRGYRGSFHLLDHMPGLEYEVNGVPAWAVWFAIIAIHSDLVVFVKEYEGDFGPAQRLEIEMTSDRVQKKLVEVPHDELKWARKADLPEGAERMYVGDGKVMTEAEWHRMEAQHAAPFVESYATTDAPRDRLFTIDELGEIASYPIDHPVYGDE